MNYKKMYLELFAATEKVLEFLEEDSPLSDKVFNSYSSLIKAQQKCEDIYSLNQEDNILYLFNEDKKLPKHVK